MGDKKLFIAEKICEGGFGSEANIVVELRTVFPGIGGAITTEQTLVCALREEFSSSPKISHQLFLKHAIIKKLDDYFHRLKKYEFAHIPRPIGSISKTNGSTALSAGGKNYEAYLYEWVFGMDGFPWNFIDAELKEIPIVLSEWNECVAAFYAAGIDLAADCADAEDGRLSQNIVHQLYKHASKLWPKLNCLWQRIDFGPKSIKINYEKLRQFLYDNQNSLKNILGQNRYEMMILSHQYLIGKETLDRIDIGKLEILTRNYRLSSLRHLSSRHINDSDIRCDIEKGEDSLV